MRQLLTESVLLSLAGGALGLATAAAVLRGVPALVPVTMTRLDEVGFDQVRPRGVARLEHHVTMTRLDEVGFDGVVLAFTLGLSVAVGLLFGAVPAFQSGSAAGAAHPEARCNELPDGVEDCTPGVGEGPPPQSGGGPGRSRAM